MPPFQGALFNLILLLMSAALGAAALSAGAGLVGSFFGANKQDKNAQAPYRDWETDRKSTRLNSSHRSLSRMPSSA